MSEEPMAANWPAFDWIRVIRYRDTAGLVCYEMVRNALEAFASGKRRMTIEEVLWSDNDLKEEKAHKSDLTRP